ncbi:2Fe-2S iron-sulfur cluster-binding protein [uncultured Clostridium sp.]|uniref:2Fe-2S iron-sulfur cluster-binding protein n=1 Tax=uncultured Clostridium sp. TaxID=59620 RepID=UPI0025D11678|nr:2Fe-2S iron-sulfur cluster-binding protein [uncultured Clostridium sp.]
MNIKVYRFNPETDASAYYDEFHVEVRPEDRMTVMGLLEYIGSEFDGTLSFYMHSVCGQGICGRCAVKVNGKVCLACNTVLTGEDVVIEPAGTEVVKDLVVQR